MTTKNEGYDNRKNKEETRQSITDMKSSDIYVTEESKKKEKKIEERKGGTMKYYFIET